MMQARSVDVTAIEAKRFIKHGERLTNVRIETNTKIRAVSRGDGDTASVDFRFSVDYPGIGYIRIEGILLVEGGADAMVGEWSSKGELPIDDANVVHNVIISHCMVVAIIQAREIKLMPPIPMPHVQLQKQQSGKPHASSGMEVA